MKNIGKMLTALALFALILSGCAPAATPTAAPAAPATSAPTAPATSAPAAPATSAPAAPATSAPVATLGPAHLVVWWWGEQEAPGAQKWMDETVKDYEALHPNVTIETVLQSTDSLIPAFTSAAAAKSGPDIQYFWGGTYTLEPAWQGALIPINNLIPADELSHYINNWERTYNGQQWGIGWYLSGLPMFFNPKMFTKAGLDPANPPQTWDQLIAACGKLKAIGVVPISGGLKDAWFGGWLFTDLAREDHDSYTQFIQAVVGNAKFTDPTFASWWTALGQLKDAGCWNTDIGSIDYQQGQDMFTQGKAAMTFGNDTFTAGIAKTLGWDSMDVMIVPKFASGKLADTYAVTAQGWGITSWSKYPQQDADFLMYMHTKDRLAAWWADTGVLPADDRLDPSLITQPLQQKIFKWDSTISGPELENFIPDMLDNDANMTGAQLLFSGNDTPAQLAQLSEATIEKWRSQNPDMLNNFLIWSK
ncbi:MAG: extracellular solute-binding protein [Anaerolineales bacterium]